MKYVKYLFLQNYLSKKGEVRRSSDGRIISREDKIQVTLKTKDDVLKSIKSLDGREARNLSAV